MLFIPLTEYLIETAGWETAWIVLAIVGMGMIVPLAVIFVRRQPEDMGLFPDGDTDPGSVEHEADTPGADSDKISWTVS